MIQKIIISCFAEGCEYSVEVEGAEAISSFTYLTMDFLILTSKTKEPA